MRARIITVLTLLLSLGLPAVAQASFISIGLGGTPMTVASNASGSTVLFTGSYNPFSPISVTASGDLLPGHNFSTTINTASTAEGQLTVWATETDITDPTGLNKFLSRFTLTALNTTSSSFSSIVESTYADAGNSAYGTTNLLSDASLSAAPASQSITSTSFNLAGPYSVTEKFAITMAGAGTSSATLIMQIPTAGNTPVPAPGSLWLMGAGLALLGLMLARASKTTRDSQC